MFRFAKVFVLSMAALILAPVAIAQTPGSVSFSATVNDYTGKTDAKHYTVVWVTKTNGTTNQFIKTLWKQGPSSWTSSEWGSHCSTWNTARASSTSFDGYTSATATSYAATNPSPPASGIASNPIKVTWNCRDAANALVADGDYKFWIQYAENSGQGPVTTGLAWTKRSTSFATTYPAQGTTGSPTNGNNFTGLSTTWTPSTVAPTFTSTAPAGGTQGAAYNHTCTASGSTPITFSVTSGALPTGLTLSSGGVISGTPTVAGTFTGAIGAANGTAPNASQAFSITIAQAIVFTSAPPPSNGNVVSAYNHTCTVIGTAPVTFSVTTGALPAGLTLSAAGVISGTPNTVGSFNGVITASNGLAPAATQNFTIVIAPATAGTLTLTATLGALGSGSDEHWSVAWITKSDGTFVKTVDIRGNAMDFWDVHWNDHCSTWYAARGTSQALDGFTSATSASYAAPLVVSWNGRDASNNLMPDGTYKLWVQYAEDVEPASGPFTTGGLTWTKGTTASTVNPPNQGGNFTAMSMVWTPAVTAAPEIAVEEPAGTNLADGGTRDFGSVTIGANSTLTFTIKNTGAADLTGLTITKDGSNPTDFTIVASPVAPVAGPAGTTTFSVQFTPGAAGSRSASIHLANNDSDENPFDITLTGTGITAYDSWAISAGLGAGADPAAAPKGDGVTNLQKFAFNMDASKADLRRLEVGAGGLAGLPGTEVASGPVLRMEYIRRKASTNPGITYTAQLGSDLTGWTTVVGQATSIDDTWERVLVTDPPPAAAAKRFGRVKVTQP